MDLLVCRYTLARFEYLVLVTLSSRGTKPLEVQRGLSATGRVPRVASADLEAFVEAGVAPPTHPRRPRVVRFNSVVDDSEPETPPLGA